MSESVECRSDGPIIIRRAVASDYEAVLDINRNIYDGLDYMPSLFFTFIQDKRHVIYVLEQDAQLISLVNFELSHDRTRVTVMSERVRPSHQRRGLSVMKFPGFKEKLLEDFPTVTQAVFVVGMRADEAPRNIPNSDILCRWEFNGYWIRMSSLSSKISSRTVSTNPDLVELSYANCMDRLTLNDDFECFFHQFGYKYLPCGVEWKPIKFNDKVELKELIRMNHVVVTFSSTNSSHSDTNDITATSYSCITQLPREGEFNVDMQYYGDWSSLDQHLASQLRHVSDVLSGESLVAFFLKYMPTHLSFAEVKGCLSGWGITQEDMIGNKDVSHRQAIVRYLPGFSLQ